MAKKHTEIPDELLDQLLAQVENPSDLSGPEGLLRQLTGRLVERARRPSSQTTSGMTSTKPEPTPTRGTARRRRPFAPRPATSRSRSLETARGASSHSS